MEEIEYLIKQEDYEKYKKLLQEFECKAIDIIEDLTYQFKETLAEEIDDKIKGWKKDNERILRENWEKDDKIKQLEQELAELKEKAIDRPKFKHLEEYWYIENNPYYDNELQVFNGKVMEIICAYDEDWLYEYRFDTSCRYIEEDNIFATEQEAQAKLKEIQGNE